MNIYEKNIVAREKGIAIIVEPSEDNDYPTLNFPIIIENLQSKSGLITSKIRVSDDDNENFIHSSYDPVSEASKKVAAIDTGKNVLIIVFGIGLAYHLVELKKRISAKSRVLVIENSQDIFNNVMKEVDITSILEDKRFSILLDLHPEQISQWFKRLINLPYYFHLASNIQFINMNYYEKLFPEFTEQVSKSMIRDTLSTWRSLGNSATDTVVGLVQNFANIDIALNNTGIKELRGVYKDKPVIIVSAGPSLDKNIDLLKEVEGKALILATDAALGGLLKRGIRPDAVFSIERVEVYECFFKNRSFEIPEDIVFVAPPLIQPEVFEEFKNNRKIVCYRAYEPINIMIDKHVDKGLIPMGSSVAHLACGFALEVGANPIVFIGQDLAFSETGETHGSDISEELKDYTRKAIVDDNVIYINDYNGNPIKTTLLWKTFLIWFENIFVEYNDRKYIDATEGGAYIKGTEIMTLRDVIDKYIAHEAIIRLNEILPDVKQVNHIDLYNKLGKFLEDEINYFEKISKLSEECLDGLKKHKKKFHADYQHMSINDNNSICRQLSKADEVYFMMKDDIIALMFFQGLFCSIIYEVNNLGLKPTNENVWKNLHSQLDFLSITRDISIAVVITMKKTKEFLDERISKYPELVKIERFIKFTTSEMQLDKKGESY